MPNQLHETSTTAPLTTTVNRMCEMLGVGSSTGWALVGGEHPEIASISIGRRRLPIVASIREYVARKAAEPHRRLANPPAGEGRKHHRANRAAYPNT
jgi:hypothetical protein